MVLWQRGNTQVRDAGQPESGQREVAAFQGQISIWAPACCHPPPVLDFVKLEWHGLAIDGDDHVLPGQLACEGCPPLRDLLARYEKAGGRYMVCPVCFNAKHLDKGDLIPGAELAGSVQLWEWIGDEGATTFSY
jgi:predicted peroxiredoxin